MAKPFRPAKLLPLLALVPLVWLVWVMWNEDAADHLPTALIILTTGALVSLLAVLLIPVDHPREVTIALWTSIALVSAVTLMSFWAGGVYVFLSFVLLVAYLIVDRRHLDQRLTVPGVVAVSITIWLLPLMTALLIFLYQ